MPYRSLEVLKFCHDSARPQPCALECVGRMRHARACTRRRSHSSCPPQARNPAPAWRSSRPSYADRARSPAGSLSTHDACSSTYQQSIPTSLNRARFSGDSPDLLCMMRTAPSQLETLPAGSVRRLLAAKAATAALAAPQTQLHCDRSRRNERRNATVLSS